MYGGRGSGEERERESAEERKKTERESEEGAGRRTVEKGSSYGCPGALHWLLYSKATIYLLQTFFLAQIALIGILHSCRLSDVPSWKSYLRRSSCEAFLQLPPHPQGRAGRETDTDRQTDRRRRDIPHSCIHARSVCRDGGEWNEGKRGECVLVSVVCVGMEQGLLRGPQ